MKVEDHVVVIRNDDVVDEEQLQSKVFYEGDGIILNVSKKEYNTSLTILKTPISKASYILTFLINLNNNELLQKYKHIILHLGVNYKIKIDKKLRFEYEVSNQFNQFLTTLVESGSNSIERFIFDSKTFIIINDQFNLISINPISTTYPIDILRFKVYRKEIN